MSVACADELGDNAHELSAHELGDEADEGCALRIHWGNLRGEVAQAALARTVLCQCSTLPPVGSGWFDVVYLDDELRCCRDVRGDLQVCRRRGT